MCPPGAFHDSKLGRVAEAVLDLGDAAEESSVAAWLDRRGELQAFGGYAGICRLTDAAASPANIAHYAAEVRESWDQRRIVELMRAQVRRLRDGEAKTAEVASTLSREFHALVAEGGDSDLQHVGALVEGALTELERRQAHGQLMGVRTGFTELDQRLSGLQPGELTVLAGRPSMGKTSLGLDIARLCGERALFISAEMTRQAVIGRLLCAVGSVDVQRYRGGQLSAAEMRRVVEAADTVRSLPLEITDRPAQTLVQIERSMHAVTARGLRLVVVDYLQLLRVPGCRDGREREIATLSSGLKTLAKRFDAHVLCLSQLNRQCESRNDKRPLLSDLRESGAIEQDADNVVMVYRDEYYSKTTERAGIAEILVRKARNGPCCVVELRFDSQYARFMDKKWAG